MSYSRPTLRPGSSSMLACKSQRRYHGGELLVLQGSTKTVCNSIIHYFCLETRARMHYMHHTWLHIFKGVQVHMYTLLHVVCTGYDPHGLVWGGTCFECSFLTKLGLYISSHILFLSQSYNQMQITIKRRYKPITNLLTKPILKSTIIYS